MGAMVKRVTKRLPNGHTRSFYQRVAGFGDGPITSPDQDPTTGEIQMPDDYVGSTPAPTTTPPATNFDSSSDQTVATVGPIITGVTTGITDTANAAAGWITSWVTGTGPTTTPAAAAVSGAPMSPLAMLLVAGTVVGAYYAYEKMKGPKKAARKTTTRRSR